MQLTEIDLHEVNESVWQAMLGFELVPCEPVPTQPDETYLVGAVTITGGADVSVMIQIPIGLARRLGSVMFGEDETSISDDEIFDALGEMANMVGGNVKGVLAADSKLSLPTVTEGREVRWSTPGGATISETFYQCEQWTVRTVMFGRAA